MAGGAFIGMLRVGVFLVLAWAASRISRQVGISSIVLEITTGLILSPSLLGLIPEEYAVCLYELHDDCKKTEVLNHIQDHYGGCDYDAYMAEKGFTLATLPGDDHSGHDDHSGSGHDDQSGHDEHSGHSPAPVPAVASPDSEPVPEPEPVPAGAPTDSGHSDGHSPGDSDDHSSGHSDEHSAGGNGHSEDHSDGHSDSHAGGDSDGHSDGHSDEHSSGHSDGHSDGDSDGHADGHPDGHSEGHSDDHPAGHSDGHSDDHSAGHSDDHSAGHSDEHSNGHSDGHAGGRLLAAVEMVVKETVNGAKLAVTGQPGARRLSTSTKGKADYETYEECLEKMCLLHVSHECTLTPNIFSFIGHVGVALMIFESGMHFDFDKAKECGPIACVIAVLGTILPLIFGTILVMLLCSKPMFPEGVSAGTALAPTSVGIALKLLNEAKQLQERHGQIIITAAFVDDILSLVLFNCLFSIGAGELSFMTFLPAIIGVFSMCGIVVFAATYADKVVLAALKLAPKKPEKKLSPEDELLFFLMMMTVLVLGTAFFFTGTHLWGCFMAGMCLAKVHSAHHVWVKQTKRMTSWMIRIFFACTVAFSIPLMELLSIDAFWKGSIMGIVACIATKVFCAFFAGNMKWIIGWAMVGRAEFAYLIAQLAASSNMMSPEVFSVCIWSLLYATVFAPFLFRWVLGRFVKARERERMEQDGGTWSKEQEEEFDKKHANLMANTDFRQSGHLPVISDRHEETTEIKHATGPTHAVSSSDSHKISSKAERPVQSEMEEQEHFHTGEGVQKMSAPHRPYDLYAHEKEALEANGQGARGNGFLCCLFFRKIIIM